MRLKLIVALVSDDKTDTVSMPRARAARPARRSSPACAAKG